MHRIDTSTAQKDKFGAGKSGFTSGNPQTGVPATEVSAEILDAMQEELCAVIEAAGMTLDKAKNNQLLAAIQVAIYPVGAPIPWPLATPPTGFLMMTGQTFNPATYPKLALAYPSGALPDLRGEFIRGWDNGRGVDVGRALLSAQGDAIRNLSGQLILSTGASPGSVSRPSLANGVFEKVSLGTNNLSQAAQGASISDYGIQLNASLQVPTANENRPRSIAFNYIVRAA